MGLARTPRRAACILISLFLFAAGQSAADELDYGIEERQVGSIRFVGNDGFSDDTLRELLPFRQPRWYAPFSAARYRTDVLPQAARALRGFYIRNGFHSAHVRIEAEERGGVGGDVLTVYISEGHQSTVRRLELRGPADHPLDELREALRFQEGGPAPFDAVDLGGDRFLLLQHFVSQGHLNAQVSGRFSRVDSLSVDIEYDIFAGKAYTVRDVRIDGHQRTKESFVRRELRLGVGDPFDLDKMVRSEIELLETGWFRDVEFLPAELDTAAGTAVLEVQLIERPTRFYEIGVGTGDEDRIRLSGAWGDRNLFASGRSLTLRGRLLWGFEDVLGEGTSQELFFDHEEELLYRSPRAFGSPFDVGVSAFFRKETLGLSGVILERSGFLANTEVFRGLYSTVEVEGSIERVRKLPLEEEIDLFGDPDATTRSISTVLSRDTRSNPFDPESGSLRYLLAETAGGFIGGANDYNKFLASYVHLQDLPADAALAFRVQAGWAEAFGDSREEDVPLEARFFAGGSNSVRGYRENSLGPRLTTADSLKVVDERFLANRPTAGGNALLQLNAELRFPIPLVSRWGFRGALFADAGNVWENWSRVSLGRLRLSSDEQGEDPTTILDLRTSVGFSLHYRTPVGPLRLDYGLPLKRAELRDPTSGDVEVDPHHIWHFSLGHAF